MFLRNDKKSPGWAFIALGIVLCAISLVGFSEIFGPVPATGRAATLTWVGIPFGIVAAIIGMIVLSRDGGDGEPRE